jgi:hypothetical protein
VPKYLWGLRKRVRDLGLLNVIISRGKPHDPRLPVDSVDVAILVHMYHEDRTALRPALQSRPGTQAWCALSPARALAHAPRVEILGLA